MKISGKYVIGKGEGKRFVLMPEYQLQFEEKLGFTPYPGTFNIQLKNNFEEFEKKLAEIRPIKISGFKKGRKIFGGCLCYPVRVGDVACFIVRPERTSHPVTVVELIAPVNLSDKLSVKEGDLVCMEV